MQGGSGCQRVIFGQEADEPVREMLGLRRGVQDVRHVLPVVVREVKAVGLRRVIMLSFCVSSWLGALDLLVEVRHVS